MRALGAGLVALMAAACGSDAGTGLGGTDIRGNWVYDVTNFSFGGITCTEHGTVLSITQQGGGTFSGTYDGGMWICNGLGTTDSSSIANGTIVSATIAGDSMRFDLDGPNWYSVGVVTGTTMGGTVNARFPQSPTPTVVAGNWSATKQ